MPVESRCKQRAREGDVATLIRIATVYTICPHPPLHNPNAFPEFSEGISSPLKENGFGIDVTNPSLLGGWTFGRN
jgi:hypothetical protein